LDNYIILENMKLTLAEKEKKIRQMEAAMANHQVSY